MQDNINSPLSNDAVSEFTPISFKELEKMTTSHGDLYWKKGSGKFVQLLHAGDYLDSKKIQKFKNITKNLYIKSICDSEFITKTSSYLLGLISTSSEKERLALREDFLNSLRPIFWNGEQKGSLLNLVIIFQDVFYDISSEFSKEMNERAVSTYRRASLYAALVTLASLCSGYSHGEYLKDIYNISFFNDYSYAKTAYSPNGEECIDHVDESLKEFYRSNYYHLKNKHLSRLISFHHEHFEGDGHNIGLNFNELNEQEKITIFIEKELSNKEHVFTLDDGEEYLRNFLEYRDSDTAFTREFRKGLRSIFLQVFHKEPNAA